MSGKRSKNLRGRGKISKPQTRRLSNGVIYTGIKPPTLARINLLESAAIATQALQASIKKVQFRRSYRTLVLPFRCAYRKVKSGYMHHKARTGESL